ncbi:MAG TPA: addiction module protein [Polyangiaceae bacterium]
MPSNRFAEALRIASDLPDEERAALAEVLWETVPDELDPALERELRGRIAEMRAAHARGEPTGKTLSFDEMMALVRKPRADEEEPDE